MMKGNSRSLWIVLSCLWAGLLLFQPALASGPGEGGRRVRMDNEPAGPYRLRVVTSPTPPLVENYNVEVRVSEAETGRVLTDVTVWISAEPAEFEGEKLRELATHEYAPIPTEYAAHILVYERGLWNVKVEVESPLGKGEVTFVERISAPASLGWVVAVLPPFLGLAILVYIFLRLQRASSREQEKRTGSQ